jgi:hypothetical protein
VGSITYRVVEKFYRKYYWYNKGYVGSITYRLERSSAGNVIGTMKATWGV